MKPDKLRMILEKNFMAYGKDFPGFDRAIDEILKLHKQAVYAKMTYYDVDRYFNEEDK